MSTVFDRNFDSSRFALAAAAVAALAINLAMATALGQLPTRGQQWLAMQADEVRLATRVRPLIDHGMTMVKDTPPTQKMPIHLSRLVTCGTRSGHHARARRAQRRAWQAGAP